MTENRHKSAVAVIVDGSSSLSVDTEHLRNITFRVGCLYQFIGELVLLPNNDAILQARIGRNVDGMDLNLYHQSLQLLQQFEAELASRSTSQKQEIGSRKLLTGILSNVRRASPRHLPLYRHFLPITRPAPFSWTAATCELVSPSGTDHHIKNQPSGGDQKHKWSQWTYLGEIAVTATGKAASLKKVGVDGGASTFLHVMMMDEMEGRITRLLPWAKAAKPRWPEAPMVRANSPHHL
ncbi:hypothetical protein Taro_013229 [Colocasia esculenta]|uniref:Uncharacterized protein n=1 Tax=Colocasia esculenta TaxID=4460 RepID=A0A843UFU2_COLES|nr:hypothetical protein [Colocasia esculenta]